MAFKYLSSSLFNEALIFLFNFFIKPDAAIQLWILVGNYAGNYAETMQVPWTSISNVHCDTFNVLRKKIGAD